MNWNRVNPEDKRDRLRKKMSDKIDDNKSKKDGLQIRLKNAVKARDKAQQAYDGVCVEIGDLERQKKSYDTEIRRLDQEKKELGNSDVQMDWQPSPSDQWQELSKNASERLSGIEGQINDFKRDLHSAEEDVRYWEGQHTKYARGVESDKRAIKRDKGKAETNLREIKDRLSHLDSEKAELEGQLKQYSSNLNAATTSQQAAEQAKVDREREEEDIKKKRGLFVDMKKEADQRLRDANTKKMQLERDLSGTKRQLTPIENDIEALDEEIKQRDMQDRTKHANIMMHVHAYLTTEDVGSLKSILQASRVIGDGEAQRLKSFTDIWAELCSKDWQYNYGIAVGNYKNLRFLLEKIKKVDLAKDVGKSETELLEQYEGDRTSYRYVQSNQTQQLITLSQSVEAKVKVGEYKKLGGPCTYLQDVMVVIKYYLGQLSTEQKNESTDAVYEFVKQKLDRSSILSLVDTHAREQRSGKKKVENLEKTLKESEKRCGELEAAIRKLTDENEKDTRTLWEKITRSDNKVKEKQDNMAKMIEDHKEQKESAEKDWEVARKDLVAEKDKLRTEKEAADKKCTEMMRMMTEIRNEQTNRFRRLEADLTKVHDKKIAHYTAMMNSMMERHRQEMKEERERYTKDTKELHECVEHYKDELESYQKKSTEALNDLRQEYHTELLELENVYGESVVESEKERMELKQNLLVATMRKEFADHRLKMANNDVDDDDDVGDNDTDL